MVTYAYLRVSTRDQNLERQEIAIKQFRPEIAEANIFRDKLTGKTFDRPQYNAMKIILEHITKANDGNEMIEVVVEELDRLGRDSDGIKKQLQWFKEHNICVRILEIPTTLIDIKKENAWVMELINQILIEVYSAMAQQELEKRAKRQAEGIAVAKEKGVKFGRRAIGVNESELDVVYNLWKAVAITGNWSTLDGNVVMEFIPARGNEATVVIISEDFYVRGIYETDDETYIKIRYYHVYNEEIRGTMTLTVVSMIEVDIFGETEIYLTVKDEDGIEYIMTPANLT